MTVLVIGGASSGKSAYGEALLIRLTGNLHRFYLATMDADGAEAASRIARHRAERAGKGFITVECPVNLAGLSLATAIPPGDILSSGETEGRHASSVKAETVPPCGVLLEDLGNLCANELYSPGGSGNRAAAEIMGGIACLRAQCRHLVIVSNEVCSGGTHWQGDTLRYLHLLAFLHRRIAAEADAVCEVTYGIPVYYAGSEPPDGYKMVSGTSRFSAK